ncbi:MAG: hypothetical protein AAFU85_29585 [Planctomycetota bacterium]
MIQSRVTWLAEKLATSTRCHLLGVTTTTLLLLAISWLWSNPTLFTADGNYSEAELTESIQLISSSSALQNRYAAVKQRRDESDTLIDSVEAWLPREQNWSMLRGSLQTLADEQDLDVIALERGSEHFGTRVSILDIHCEVEGSYFNVCKFLERLSNREHPLWCDEIRLQRENEDTPVGPSRQERVCVAVMSLRAPFAGKGSDAQKLLEMGATP